MSAAGWLGPVAKEPGPRDRGPLAMPPGPPTSATTGARVGVLRFDQAQADQSPVLIHSLDRVAVQLEFADHGRWGVKPSRAQRRERHRLLTSTTQLLKRQTMLSLNERHRTELSMLGPRRSRLFTLPPFLGQSGARSRHSDHSRAEEGRRATRRLGAAAVLADGDVSRRGAALLEGHPRRRGLHCEDRGNAPGWDSGGGLGAGCWSDRACAALRGWGRGRLPQSAATAKSSRRAK